MYSLFLEFARADEEIKIKTAADKLLRIVHAHMSVHLFLLNMLHAQQQNIVLWQETLMDSYQLGIGIF